MLTEILTVLVVGTVAGVLGRLLLPGREYVAAGLTIFVGVIAAFVGTALARAAGIASGDGIRWAELAVQVVLALACVTLVAGRRPRAVPGRHPHATTGADRGR